MSSDPPRLSGTMWSASSTTPVTPQHRHFLPYLSQSSSNSWAVKFPGLACFAALLLRPLLALDCLTFSTLFLPHSFARSRPACRPRRARYFPLTTSFCTLRSVPCALFLVLSSRLDPVRQVGPRPLVLGVLLAMAAIVFARPCLNARFAVVQVTIRHPGAFVELREPFTCAAPPARLQSDSEDAPNY